MMMVMKRARHTDETVKRGKGKGEGNSKHINVSEQWQLRTG